MVQQSQAVETTSLLPPTQVSPPAQNSRAGRIARVNTDIQCWRAFVSGKSLEQIVKQRNLPAAVVEQAIQRGEFQEAVRRRNEISEVRHKAALANEKIRQRARLKLARKMIDSLEKLLDAKEMIIERRPDPDNPGEELITVHEQIHHDTMSRGVALFPKTVSLEDRGVIENTAPGTVVNVQQNSVPQMPPSAPGVPTITFEERIMQLKLAQLEAAPDKPGEVLEGEVEAVTEVKNAKTQSDADN